MVRIGLVPRLVALTMGLALALPASAVADVYYTAVLDGPTAGTTSPATGTAILTLNAAETEVSYYIEYSELSGNETVAHIHNAPPGILGPLFHDLDYGSPKIGIWEVGPFEVAELNAGRVNILIHSDLFLVSEIRGDVEFNSVSGVELPANGDVPADLILRSNFPNPFNPLTTINYGVPREERVLLDIFDTQGRLVSSLLDEIRSAGYHSVVWDGTDNAGSAVASGVYVYRVVAGDRVAAQKMLLMK